MERAGFGTRTSAESNNWEITSVKSLASGIVALNFRNIDVHSRCLLGTSPCDSALLCLCSAWREVPCKENSGSPSCDTPKLLSTIPVQSPSQTVGHGHCQSTPVFPPTCCNLGVSVASKPSQQVSVSVACCAVCTKLSLVRHVEHLHPNISSSLCCVAAEVPCLRHTTKASSSPRQLWRWLLQPVYVEWCFDWSLWMVPPFLSF